MPLVGLLNGSQFPLEQWGGTAPDWFVAMGGTVVFIGDTSSPPTMWEPPEKAPPTYPLPPQPRFDPTGPITAQEGYGIGTGPGGLYTDADAARDMAHYNATVGMPTGVAVSPNVVSAVSSTPLFRGGRPGRVRFTSIRNRQIGGVRVGTLPMVVFEESALNLSGLTTSWGGGGTAEIAP